jgi:hypothetical protein
MVKCGVLFVVRTEFLNSIYTSFCLKELNKHYRFLKHMVLVLSLNVFIVLLTQKGWPPLI